MLHSLAAVYFAWLAHAGGQAVRIGFEMGRMPPCRPWMAPLIHTAQCISFFKKCNKRLIHLHIIFVHSANIMIRVRWRAHPPSPLPLPPLLPPFPLLKGCGGSKGAEAPKEKVRYFSLFFSHSTTLRRVSRPPPPMFFKLKKNPRFPHLLCRCCRMVHRQPHWPYLM